MEDAKLYPPPFRAWSTVVLLLLAYLLSLLDRQILSLMVEPIRADLQISDFQMGLLQGVAFIVLFTVAALPLATIADRHVRKYVIIGAVSFWSLATAACGLATSFVGLFAARLGVGVGEAGLNPAAYSMLADSFPPRRLVRANAVYTLGALLGSGVALLAGASVIDYFNHHPTTIPGLEGAKPWQMVFIALGVPGLVLALVFLLFIKEPARLGDVAQPPRLHLVLGQLWRQRADYGPFYVSTLLLGCVTYSQGNWMPTHLIRFFHMDVREVGLSLGVMLMIGALLGTLLGPALVEWRVRRGDRSPHLRAVLIISALLVPAMAGPAMPTLPAALVMMSVYYVLQTAFVSPMVTGVQILAPNRLRGVAVALWALIGNIGGLGIGVALVGAIADWLFPNQPDGIGKAMMIVGMTASGLCALWAAWCLSRKAVVTARVAVDG